MHRSPLIYRNRRSLAAIRVAVTAAAGTLVCCSVANAGLHYRIERVASGLAQPTFLTQAPGDPSNIVYYSTRITNTGSAGFGAINNMGGIFRYDLNTRISTPIFNLNSRQLTGDEGLVGFAFSPDFNISGAPGFHKFYVSSSQYNGGASPIERVEEYTYNGDNTSSFSRLILQYNNINTQQNHTIDWIGFDPTTYSHGTLTADRNYLYVVAGDGDLGGSAQSRPEQKANSVLGKVLRLDVNPTHADAYPHDSNKNFAIPLTNPVPLWNAAHPANQQLVGTHMTYSGGTITTADYNAGTNAYMGEIYATGTRNSFRSSIDRQTGDLWMGDVGENTREEVNFLKAGTYNGMQPPVDFGYASREGTIPTNGGLAVANSSGSTTLRWNTGTVSIDDSGTQSIVSVGALGSVTINSTNPVREGDHSATNTTDHQNGARSSYIGGYVYRGPITELQGKYIYADFVNSNIYMLDGVDRNMSLDSYSGTNFNQDPTTGLAALGNRTTAYHAGAFSGATTPVDGAWANLVVDPLNPGGPAPKIGRVVSFSEDESGNVYIIDFGGTFGDVSFAQDYPGPTAGQIFRLTPITINSTWNVNGLGTWSVDANWTGGGGAPNGVGDQANFLTSFGPRIASVDTPTTISTITFDSAQSYTISGPSTLTLQGVSSSPAAINVNSGTHTISAAVVLNSDLTMTTSSAGAQLFFSGGLNATGRTLTKLGPGLVQFGNLRASGLVASEGTVRIGPKGTPNDPTGTSVLSSLVIGGSGQVDLTNNSMIIDYTGPVGTLVSDTRANLRTGKLMSSSADATRRLGYADNAVLHKTTFAGQSVDSSSVLVKYTYAGDADLDGDADGVDIGTWATNFTGELGGTGSAVWTEGDWDYDGDVDGVDAGLWAQAFTGELGGAGLGSMVIDDPDIAPGAAAILRGLGITVVPEPAAALLLIAPLALARRRRALRC